MRLANSKPASAAKAESYVEASMSVRNARQDKILRKNNWNDIRALTPIDVKSSLSVPNAFIFYAKHLLDCSRCKEDDNTFGV